MVLTAVLFFGREREIDLSALVGIFKQKSSQNFVSFSLFTVTDATAIAAYATAEFTCTGPYGEFPPKWLLDGKGALTVGVCHNSTLTETRDGNATATLIILNNDSTCDAFNISCRIFIWQSHFLYLHNTTLEMEGLLPSCHSIVIGLTI